VVTLKDDHALVRTGPYKYVRHPIYSGLLLAVCGSAAVAGEWRGILALGLAIIAVLYKSRVEEARMRETFSEYGAYCRETAALIPFLF
jgi:protein-S-isoprenylcysteine O-methyltransferase Ste14